MTQEVEALVGETYPTYDGMTITVTGIDPLLGYPYFLLRRSDGKVWATNIKNLLKYAVVKQ
mgnify:CR=1 FL=1